MNHHCYIHPVLVYVHGCALSFASALYRDAALVQASPLGEAYYSSHVTSISTTAAPAFAFSISNGFILHTSLIGIPHGQDSSVYLMVHQVNHIYTCLVIPLHQDRYHLGHPHRQIQ